MGSTCVSLIRVFASVLLFSFPLVGAEGFNRDVCFARVQGLLHDGLLASNDSAFFRNNNGMSMSDPEQPVLNIAGCERICGKSFGWNKDAGPRLSTWLIPVFLLISNMEVSPLDKRRYQMLVHLLGDPIDTLWSLLSKMEAWSRCHALAKKMCRGSGRRVRNLATVLGAFEDLIGIHASPADVYTYIIQRSQLDPIKIDDQIARAAQKLADSRTDERLRTLLATVLYIYQLVSAFIATVGGGNTSPPGGRIGITMFMTWIIPSILISNAIGCFTSRRTCFDILEDFVRHVTPDTDLWSELQCAVPELQQYQSIEGFFDALAWSGAIYSYRSSKRLPFKGGPRDRSPYLLLLLAVAPILISSIIASVILWNTPPIGINCRNLLIFSIVIFIFLSALFTSATSWPRRQGAKHWYLVFAKDICISVPFVVLVFLATAGRFNSCWCWSGVYTLGPRAHIPLNTMDDFVLFNSTTYPILVSVCLSLLILAFGAMMWVGWRGWNVMRWSEKDRQDEWSRSRLAVVHEESCSDRLPSSR